MRMAETFEAGKTIMGSMDCGEDLAETLGKVCIERNIRCGRVEAIGAVRSRAWPNRPFTDNWCLKLERATAKGSRRGRAVQGTHFRHSQDTSS